MRHEVPDHVDRIPNAESVEVNAGSFGGMPRGQHRERTKGEMTDIHDHRHAEQSEHLAVGVHDSWNVVQQIDEQKHCAETPGTLLNSRYPVTHKSVPSIYKPRRWNVLPGNK